MSSGSGILNFEDNGNCGFYFVDEHIRFIHCSYSIYFDCSALFAAIIYVSEPNNVVFSIAIVPPTMLFCLIVSTLFPDSF